MKSAHQVREYVRRRCLQERDSNKQPWHDNRVRELAFIEVLNAFDTLHKTKLEMPTIP